MKISTFDTTLRDGTQGESISFSVDDKLIIAQKLDELGIDYIEGGWPGSNPKDQEFFKRATELTLHHARLTAFGSTRFAKNPVHEDRNVRALVEAGTPVVAIFGKTWDLHVKRALGITVDQNLVLISETVRDTNGGTVPPRLVEMVAEVRRRFDGVIGIHVHNDGDLAVANTLAAVEAGATHVQGCMNGYGERCGNANLASVIANLELKLQHSTIGSGKLAGLAGVCRFIAELANLPLRNDQPFVGKSAFAHKGGVHVSPVLKDSATYEHIKPELVGNRQRVLVSDLSGRGNIIYKLKQHGLADRLEENTRRELLERIKQLEYEGYELEAADAHALHPFQVELDAFLGDVAVHPVPPDARFGALGWVLEASLERVARVLRGDNPCPHQRGQENHPAGLPGPFEELHMFLSFAVPV